ncbi:MAG: hypothetical protein SAL70_18870 [Scytonema sp. PMC 1070.18]|nr:hypothetical protein [Scytonema sp. PMC 1070.18]
MTQHILFFIHGIGEKYLEDDYRVLEKACAKAYCDTRKVSLDVFENQFKCVYINWQKVTADAQLTLFHQAFPQLEVRDKQFLPWDLTSPIVAARKFMTFFLGDVAAYVSENDNNIRRTVWEQMEPHISQGVPYSIISHSLGSVIVFDYLFNLFEENTLFLPESKDAEPFPTPAISQLQLNFRHLFTLGSPIGLFMLRKGDLWKGGREFETIKNPVKNDTQRSIQRTWLNFYDDQDIIAYPLEKLFSLNPNRDKGSIKDVLVNTGWLVVDSHLRYWQNQQVATEISQVLLRMGV